MSIEFLASLPEPLSDEIVRGVMQDCLTNSDGKLIFESARGFGIALKSAIGAGEFREDVIISVNATNVYVAFHAGTKGQREMFLAVLSSAFAKHGVCCTFEED